MVIPGYKEMRACYWKQKNICKSFHTKQVLNGINFQVEKGEIHGLVGKKRSWKKYICKYYYRTDQ